MRSVADAAAFSAFASEASAMRRIDACYAMSGWACSTSSRS